MQYQPAGLPSLASLHTRERWPQRGHFFMALPQRTSSLIRAEQSKRRDGLGYLLAEELFHCAHSFSFHLAIGRPRAGARR